MTTPIMKPTGVHWALDIDMSSFGSPSNTSTASFASTSTLQYLNSQLVSHGFISSPGLCLDGLSTRDMENTVKCMMGMLSQRMQDMGRAEELTTKFRSLSYEHERLLSMHRCATEKVTFTDKELTLHKSRLAASERTIEAMANSLRKEKHELQRTRSTLQGIRQTYVAEVKRKEKEMERMVEKWCRISDAQSKVTATVSGCTLKGANAAIVEGVLSEVGGGDGYLDVALREAEHSRQGLAADNSQLRDLVLNAVNGLRSSLSLTKRSASISESTSVEERAQHTQVTLFPLAPPGYNFAHETLSSLLSSLDAAVESLSQPNQITLSAAGNGASQPNTKDGKVDVGNLQETIDALKGELEQAHEANAQEIQALFDRFTAESAPPQARSANPEMSVELMTAPTLDLERERVEALRRELNHERERFTEATVRLGKERAKLEEERSKLREEKRQMQFDLMLADLPPTPTPAAAVHVLSTPARSRTKPQATSPKRPPMSPLKKSVGGKARASRRSSFGLSSIGKKRIEPSYETEVIPPGTVLEPPSFNDLLSTKFFLPPPSPMSSLPTEPVAISLSLGSVPTIPEEDTYASPTSSPTPNPNPQSNTTPPSPPVQTPRRPFPIAKPHAQHMIHAYSPVKPSPLSRILMLSDSPEGIGSAGSAPVGLDVVREDPEEEMFPIVERAPDRPSLAAELGLKEGDDECTSPLAGKKTATARNSDLGLSRRSQGRAAVRARIQSRPSAAHEKMKGRAGPSSSHRSGGRELGPEKENEGKESSAKAPPSAFGLLKSKSGSKLPSTSIKGGAARRVPVNSASAGWRR